MSPEKPPRDRCMAALTIAQEALRHIARVTTSPHISDPQITEAANHALNKIGILMTNGE